MVVLEDICNIWQLLKPENVHPVHDLHDGMLLLTSHIKEESGTAKGWMCKECTWAIKRNTIPRHTLANNLWLGDVPHELEMLTLPEQMLIARHFPQCYVVKLFP